MSAWQRQPFLACLAVGATAWVVSALVLPAPRERIVVDARTVQSVVERRADFLGRDLTPEERDEAIEARIDEEILLREAYRRGLHLSNGRVRARLLRRMRQAINTEVLPPTPAQVRAYYSANRARYPAAALDDIESFVRMDWTFERMAQVTERKLARMLSRYDVEVAGRQ